MVKPAALLQKAAGLRAAGVRDKANKVRQLAVGFQGADEARLLRYSEDLRALATELEQQAAAQVPSRPLE